MLTKPSLDKVLASYPDIRDKILTRAREQIKEQNEMFTKTTVTRTTHDTHRGSCVSYPGTTEEELKTKLHELAHAQDDDATQTEANASNMLSPSAQTSADTSAKNGSVNASSPGKSQDESGPSSQVLIEGSTNQRLFQ